MKIRLETSSDSSIRDEINEKFDELKEEFVGRVSGYYGSNFVNDNMFEDGVVFKNQKPMKRSEVFVGSEGKPLFEEIAKRYQEAWEDKYKEIQDSHKSRFAQDEGAVSHVQSKRDASNQGKSVPHIPGRPHHNYEASAWSIWSGFMKETISDAFKSGGDGRGRLKVGNYLVFSGYMLDEDKWPSIYFKSGGFHEWFEDAGIEGAGDELMEFEPDFWSQIQDLMTRAATEGFVQPFVEIFDNLEIAIH